MLRHAPEFTLLPYTTLFRSLAVAVIPSAQGHEDGLAYSTAIAQPQPNLERGVVRHAVRRHLLKRSEEHTSELQSQSNIVCRLLLEKKKKYKGKPSTQIHIFT